MKGIVLSLFDYSGVMVEPWLEAGYECYIFDIQHPEIDITPDGLLHKLKADLLVPFNPSDYGIDIDKVVFISAFPPCDHLAVSGSRWFKRKGLRSLAEAINMVATAQEVCEASNAPYMIENPVSTLSTYWRKPDHYFHPYWFTGYEKDDNYTKKTCLWTGNGFLMPIEYQDYDLGPPDDRIHKAPPGENRKNFRSKTPLGFARAVFEANEILT